RQHAQYDLAKLQSQPNQRRFFPRLLEDGWVYRLAQWERSLRVCQAELGPQSVRPWVRLRLILFGCILPNSRLRLLNRSRTRPTTRANHADPARGLAWIPHFAEKSAW